MLGIQFQLNSVLKLPLYGALLRNHILKMHKQITTIFDQQFIESTFVEIPFRIVIAIIHILFHRKTHCSIDLTEKSLIVRFKEISTQKPTIDSHPQFIVSNQLTWISP